MNTPDDRNRELASALADLEAAAERVASLAKGIRADLDHCGRSLKAQFKYANKTGAPLTAVIGDEEAAAGNVKIKNMASGEEATVAVNEACEKVRIMLG